MVEGVCERLVDLICFRLCVDVLVGIYLFGGIDLLVVVGIVIYLVKMEYVKIGDCELIILVICFSVWFLEEFGYDEFSIVERIVKWFGVEIIKVDVNEVCLVSDFFDIVWYCEYYYFDFNIVVKFVLFMLFWDYGVKVVFMGEGVDEYFVGYFYFFVEFFCELDFVLLDMIFSFDNEFCEVMR